MAKRYRPIGQCNKCGKIYPETDEFFFPRRRRGRVELRAQCKNCYLKDCHKRSKKNAIAIREYNKRRARTPHHREIMRAAWRKFHAKPGYRELERARYRKTVSTLAGREKIRIKVRRRRAREHAASGYHDLDDVLSQMRVQKSLCFYCSTDVSVTYTVDHKIPLVRGGSDGPSNIVIACPGCNFRKADKTPEEFAAGITHRRLEWGKGLRVKK